MTKQIASIHPTHIVILEQRIVVGQSRSFWIPILIRIMLFYSTIVPLYEARGRYS
jgi:hypothetical protein